MLLMGSYGGLEVWKFVDYDKQEIFEHSCNWEALHKAYGPTVKGNWPTLVY